MTEIDTGDTVHHQPTGEDWVVASVQNKKLAWLGWPPGWADLADCTLIRKATASERQKQLVDLSTSGHHCAAWAAKRLQEPKS